MRLTYFLVAIAIGIGATLLMDLWNLFLKRAFGIPSLNYCMLGRWVRHMPEGRFRHASITKAPARSFECQVGWLTHYTIGATLAIVFVALVSDRWLAQPTPLPAVIYGVATVIFPLFVMQPALGLGVASAKTPNPAKARVKSLATHLIFGIGLYLTALAARHI